MATSTFTTSTMVMNTILPRLYRSAIDHLSEITTLHPDAKTQWGGEITQQRMRYQVGDRPLITDTHAAPPKSISMGWRNHPKRLEMPCWRSPSIHSHQAVQYP